MSPPLAIALQMVAVAGIGAALFFWRGRLSMTLFALSLPAAFVLLHQGYHWGILTCGLLALGIDTAVTLLMHHEPYRNRRRKHKTSKAPSKEPSGGAPPDEVENFDDAHVDLGTTFLKSYQRLNPEQIASMKADTRELMETQKELMTVMKDMGPAVEQGLNLVQNFKTYFGQKLPGQAA
jgi:hypothetical protein